MPIKNSLHTFLIIFSISLFSKTDDPQNITQLRIGNLALPSSQQPGPLLAFGQNIVDKNDFQAFVLPNITIGDHKNFTEVTPSFLYGINNNLSLFLQLPIAAHLKHGCDHSSGIEDIIAQLEYAFYDKQTQTKTDEMTLVGALYIPAGKEHKEPPTGFGSTSFFLGITAYHIGIEWYGFFSTGGLLTTKHCKNKIGNQFLYQAGFGKNIAYKSDQWLLMWILELHGTYTQKSTSNGKKDPNSGGNNISLCPSLWFSTQHFVAQAGIAPVVSEHLFGKQLKNWFTVTFDFGWKFN